MIVTKERPHMYFDVDGTLVRPVKDGEDFFNGTVIIGDKLFKINLRVIEDLKICRTRGHTCVVWSQGGSWWAETVIRALNLVSYVDVVMAKPSWYVDDRKPGTILDDSRWYDGEF